jgi:AraC-like DNA-binding protein
MVGVNLKAINMSVATVKTVASRFLTSKTPEVLALKGSWGSGKTFAWNQLVLQNKDNCKLPNYCYVSLFGISSITELRTAIFAKTVMINLLGDPEVPRAINTELATHGWEMLRSWGYRLSKFKDVPYLKNLSVGLEALAPHLIRKTIICLDDFERLNADRIKPEEILGFISELKEEKECKIVLIFNEDELQSKAVYQRYREKVIDIEVLFAPTAEEAADLALPDELPVRETIKKYAVSLGIRNIRILQKIANLANIMQDAIGVRHIGVMEQAAMTLVLLAWCYYDSDESKPTMEFIIEWNRMVWGFKEREAKAEDPKQAIWAKTLQDYGLMHMDEFDQSIYKVIKCGYLEETGFIEEAQKLEAQILASELEQSFSAAWGLFHDTFADNQEILIKALVDSFKKSVRHISPLNLSGTSMLLRQLGESAIADELIDYYMDKRANERALFDLDNHPFSSDIRDEVIRSRFRKQFAERQVALSLQDAVMYIAAGNGWSQDHINSLMAASEDDFYRLFKENHGKSLNAIIKSCLEFDARDEYKKIGQAARAALQTIGNESPLNAIRVRRYGVLIDEKS